MRRPSRGAELFADRLIGRGVVVIAIDIAQQTAQLVVSRRIQSTVLLEAVAGPCPEPVEVPAGLGYADDWHFEVATFQHRLQRREDLLVGQIARRAEEDQGVGVGIAHHTLVARAHLRAAS